MDEYDKQYQAEPTDEEEAYYYEQMEAAQQNAQFEAAMAGLGPKERAEYIQQMRAMAMAKGELNPGEYGDSEDDAFLFDDNDLANRIWEDNELEQDGW